MKKSTIALIAAFVILTIESSIVYSLVEPGMHAVLSILTTAYGCLAGLAVGYWYIEKLERIERHTKSAISLSQHLLRRSGLSCMDAGDTTVSGTNGREPARESRESRRD